MSNDGIVGREFTPVNCIDAIRDKYGIDLDKREG